MGQAEVYQGIRQTSEAHSLPSTPVESRPSYRLESVSYPLHDILAPEIRSVQKVWQTNHGQEILCEYTIHIEHHKDAQSSITCSRMRSDTDQATWLITHQSGRSQEIWIINDELGKNPENVFTWVMSNEVKRPLNSRIKAFSPEGEVIFDSGWQLSKGQESKAPQLAAHNTFNNFIH